MTIQAMKKVTAIRPETMLPKRVTYAATLDWRDQEHVITDSMIRRACEAMEDEQQYPFGAANRPGKLVASPVPPRRLHS
ncbi:MAG: hypothetical protein KTR35_00920 [Gammaproteobacteria bacterium]|nr:hypothetical protein [Gammaproteobacteria bacterium]